MGLLWILTVFPALLCAHGVNPAADLAGGWTGEAKVLNSYTDTRQLAVALDIGSDGSVTGKVGDAHITSGRIELRRWWQLRAFNHYDIRVDFGLSGQLTDDGVIRKTGTIALVPRGAELDGWFFSEGSHGFLWQSRETLRATAQLQATRLTLRRR